MAKKRGRPRATKEAPSLPKMEEPPFSFDTDAVLAMASVTYGVREAIQELAVSKAKIKKCIPKATVVAAIKQLKLSQYLDSGYGDNGEE